MPKSKISTRNSVTISLVMDKDLAKQASAVLKERGTTIETYFRLQLRAFATGKSVKLKLADVMTFGKYQGELVEDICRADFNYINWLVLNSKGDCKFDVDVLLLLEQLVGGNK